MATAIVTDPGLILTDFPSATVSTRASWADSWTERSRVYPLRLTQTTGDRISRGSFIHHFGEILWDEDDEFQDVNRLILHRNYVKLEYTPQTGPDDPIEPVTWYGVIVQDDRTRYGSHQHKYAGDQVLQAVGLEWLLTRVVVSESKVRVNPGFPAGPSTVTIGRGLAFNARTEDRWVLQGNRTSAKHTGDISGWTTYQFSETPSDMWTAYNAVEYLFDSLNWDTDLELAIDSGVENMLDWLVPTDVETDGRTLYDVLNQLIDRRHGLAWSMEVRDSNAPTSTEDRLTLVVHSFAPSAISLPSSDTLPANANLKSLDFDEAYDIVRSLEVTDSSDVYDQIVCQGARRGSVFTLSVPDGTLVQAWTAALEAEYDAAASTAADYAGLGISEQERRNTAYRNKSDMRNVFTTFKVPDTWDGLVGNGSGDAGQTWRPAWPALDASGEPTGFGSIDVWVKGIRFDNSLPLIELYDYTTDPANPTIPAGLLATPDKRKPIAVCRVSVVANEWLNMATLADQDNERIEISSLRLNGYSFSSDFIVSETAPMVKIDPSGETYLQAGPNWIPSSPAVSPSVPEVDWRQFAITVYAQSDDYVEAVWPLTVGSPIYGDQLSKLYLRFGDRARMDWLVKGTILDVDDQLNPVRAQNQGWIRNDHTWLQDVARAAWSWHSLDRAAFELEYKQLSSLFSIGDLITTIGSGDTLRTVNSLVTSITWDFQQGSTVLQTQFADTLDFAELV